MKKKTVKLIFDPAKKLTKVDFMNAMAAVVQVLNTDPAARAIEIEIHKGGHKTSTIINLS